MPGCDCGSYPALLALTVYVSGGSEMNENAPAASETLCAVCDGEAAITTAPAIGRVRRRVDDAAAQRAGRAGDRLGRHGKKHEGDDRDGDGVSHKEERR